MGNPTEKPTGPAQPTPARTPGERLLESLSEPSPDVSARTAAAVLEFTLHNSSGEIHARAIEPLRWLGSHQEYRGKAIELLGIVAQNDDPETAAAAEAAARTILQ